MNGRQRSRASDELAADVDGTPCPVQDCAAHTQNTAQCTNALTGDPMPAAHWQRVRAADKTIKNHP